MKKLFGLFLLLCMMYTLTACSGIPKGVDQKFHDKAISLFIEIDDDTMELENSDADDVANFQLVKAMANSNREMDFVNGLEGMLKLQQKVIGNPAAGIGTDGKSLSQYMQIRQNTMDSMNFGDVQDFDDFEVPAFEFTEETD